MTFFTAPRVRGLVLLTVLATLLALPLGGAALAAVPTSTFPGTIGTVVEHSGDGLAPTFRYRGLQRFDTAQLIAEDTFDAATTC